MNDEVKMLLNSAYINERLFKKMTNEEKILGIKEFIEDAKKEILYAPEKRIPGTIIQSKSDIIRDIKKARRQLKQLTKREEV